MTSCAGMVRTTVKRVLPHSESPPRVNSPLAIAWAFSVRTTSERRAAVGLLCTLSRSLSFLRGARKVHLEIWGFVAFGAFGKTGKWYRAAHLRIVSDSLTRALPFCENVKNGRFLGRFLFFRPGPPLPRPIFFSRFRDFFISEKKVTVFTHPTSV